MDFLIRTNTRIIDLMRNNTFLWCDCCCSVFRVHTSGKKQEKKLSSTFRFVTQVAILYQCKFRNIILDSKLHWSCLFSAVVLWLLLDFFALGRSLQVRSKRKKRLCTPRNTSAPAWHWTKGRVLLDTWFLFVKAGSFLSYSFVSSSSKHRILAELFQMYQTMY